MKINTKEVSVKQLDHLGMAAGIIDELGLVEKIDRLIPCSGQSKLSIGNRVKGMVLSGLGFTNYRLYMSEHFFTNKPVKRLFDDTVEAEHFNDDALGRCLDKIHEYGSSSFYAQIAYAVAKEKGLLEQGYRHDTTSISVHGDYEEFNDDSIQITHGFSKDHRFDLKQITLMLTMSLSNSFPLWVSPLDGNASDKKVFHEVDKKFRAFKKQLKSGDEKPLVVGDSALYSSELLKRSAEDVDFYWLTRVPESIADAKKLCMRKDSDIEWMSLDNGYKIANYIFTRENIEQRWQLVYSEKAFISECKTFKKRLAKQKEKCESEIRKVKSFACEADAHKYIKKTCKNWKHHKFNYAIETVSKHKKRGRPAKNNLPEVSSYRIVGNVIEDDSAIKDTLNTKGRFILATNQLDKKQLADNALLSEYKGQASLERGFRFLKDPWFMVSSVFLKKNTRVEALMVIMTLCLMVYNFAERHMRKQLKESGIKLPSQTKKLTEKPTLKWVFQLMEGISELTFNPKEDKTVTILSTLKDVHLKILSCFNHSVRKIYDLNTGAAP